MALVRLQLPAGSTTKEAFIAAIEELAARAIAAKQEPEGQQPNASPATPLLLDPEDDVVKLFILGLHRLGGVRRQGHPGCRREPQLPLQLQAGRGRGIGFRDHRMGLDLADAASTVADLVDRPVALEEGASAPVPLEHGDVSGDHSLVDMRQDAKGRQLFADVVPAGEKLR